MNKNIKDDPVLGTNTKVCSSLSPTFLCGTPRSHYLSISHHDLFIKCVTNKQCDDGKQGTIAFAAESEPNTRSTQVFINFKNNSRLGMGKQTN